MARINVPGLKKATGVTTFDPLADGEYTLRVTEWKEKEDKNHAPMDIYGFTFDVLSGPPQANGSSPKGRKFWNDFRILRAEHPSMTGKDPETQPGVNELKAFIMAAGIETKGDVVNFDAAIGLEVGARIVQTKAKTGDKIFNNVREWYAVE
jgi:hypothetical protein